MNPHGLRKILLPICARQDHPRATWIARALARSLSAKLLLVHVVTRPPREDEPVSFGEILATARAFDRVAESRLVSEDIPVSRHMVSAPTVECGIRILAAKERPDLIMMSTRRCNSPAHAQLESVTAKLLRHSTCPILCIPESARVDSHPEAGHGVFKRILVVRQSVDPVPDPLDMTFALAGDGDVEIQLLDMTGIEPWPTKIVNIAAVPPRHRRLRGGPQPRTSKSDAAVEPVMSPPRQYAADGEPLVAGLARYAKSHGVDLLVMRHAPYALIFDVGCPVLSV